MTNLAKTRRCIAWRRCTATSLLLVALAFSSNAQQIIVPAQTAKDDTIRAWMKTRITVMDSIFFNKAVNLGRPNSVDGLMNFYRSANGYAGNMESYILSAPRNWVLPDASGIFATIDGGQTFTNAIWHGTLVDTFYTLAKVPSWLTLTINGTSPLLVSGGAQDLGRNRTWTASILDGSNLAFKDSANNFLQRITATGGVTTGDTAQFQVGKVTGNFTSGSPWDTVRMVHFGKKVLGKAATFFVAASDASSDSKQAADFVCTGTNDEVIIQAAIDSIGALSDHRGRIVLSEGHFFLAGTINANREMWISGMGVSPTNVFKSTSAHVFTLSPVAQTKRMRFSDMTIVDQSNSSGSAFYITRSDEIQIKDCEIGGFHIDPAIRFASDSASSAWNIISNAVFNGDSVAIQIDSSAGSMRDLQIIGCRFLSGQGNSNTASIRVKSGAVIDNGVLIANNVFKDGGGILIDGGGRYSILSNHFQHQGAQPSGGFLYNIKFSDRATLTNVRSLVGNNLFSGPEFVTNDIYVGANLDSLHIIGNSFSNSTTTKINVTAGSNPHGTIQGNFPLSLNKHFSGTNGYADTIWTLSSGTIVSRSPFHITSASGGAGNALTIEQLANNATVGSSYIAIDFRVPTTGLIGQFLATANNYSSASVNLTANSVFLGSLATSGQLALMAGGSSGYMTFNTAGVSAANEAMRISRDHNLLIGTTTDDGRRGLQVHRSAKFDSTLTVTGLGTFNGGVNSGGSIVNSAMPSDSTGLAQGTLWYDPVTGTVHRKHD